MVWFIAAKFLSYLGFSLLLARIVSRWVHGPAWSKLPLSWAWAGLALLLLGAALGVGATLSSLGFTAPADILDYLSATRQGKAAVASVLGAVLLLMAEAQASVWVLGPVGALFVAGGLGAAGHAAELGFFWGMLDSLHALAAATWVGGILALGLQKPTASEAQNFSRVAGICVILLLLSGVAAALQHLPLEAWGAALLHTSWGLVLLTKLGLMVLALLVSLVVRARLQAASSRVVQRARRGKGADAPQAEGFLAAETALLLLVLGLSGALVSSPLPANVVVQPQTESLSVRLGGQQLTGQLSVQGRGEVTVQFAPPLRGVQAQLTMTDHAMPAQSVPLDCALDSCQGRSQLWMSGNWVLKLSQGGRTVKVPFRY